MVIASAAHAQKGTLQFGEENKPKQPPPAPPPVWRDPNFQPSTPPPAVQTQPGSQAPVYVYEQKLYGGRQPLVTQEQAQTIVNRFKEAYPKLGSPRLLIYVNRELVDEKSGLKLIHREEKTESARGGTNAEPILKVTGENTYRSDGKAEPTLADKQTIRDVERLFGRPLRTAGAALADQRVATQLISDRPLPDFIGSTDTPQARKDREALSQVADAVIEILISSKSIVLPTISDSRTVTIPDIQATAIRLKDSKILAQVSSTDVTDRVPPANLSGYTVNEIAEATALALMEDLSSSQ
jgi:hypothetical protein